MSYTPKQQGSAGSGGQSSQQAKTLAGITQQMQNLVHGQNALPQAAQAGLGAFANLNMTLQQQQQQQRFESIIKQQQQLLFSANPQFQQHFQQQMQQNAAKEPLALTRSPAELLNKIQHHQQQANGSASATSLANNLTNQQLQQQLQAFSQNPANLMQQLQAYQYQMQQQQNQQKMLTLNQAQQSLSTLQAQTVAQQHMQQIQQTLQQQQKLIASHNKNMASTNQMKSSPASNPQATATQPIQSNNNVANKPAVKTGSTVSNQQQKQIGALQNLAKNISNVNKTVIPSTAAQKTSLSPQLASKSPSPKIQVNAVPLTKPGNKPQTPPIKTTTVTSQSPQKAGLLPSSPPKPASTSTTGVKSIKTENTAKNTTITVSGTVQASSPTTVTTVSSPTKASTLPAIASQGVMHPEETLTTQTTSTATSPTITTSPTTTSSSSTTTTISSSSSTTTSTTLTTPATAVTVTAIVTSPTTTSTATETALDEHISTEPTVSNENESAKGSPEKKDDEKKEETEPINAENDKHEEKVSKPEEKDKQKVVQETTGKSPTKIEETVTVTTSEKSIIPDTTSQDDGTPTTSPTKSNLTAVTTTLKTTPKLKSVLRKIPSKLESATITEAHEAEQSTLGEKRKATVVRESVMPEKVPKTSTVVAQDYSEERRSKRHRLKTIPYQSPLPELAFFAKLSATEALGLPKIQEDKLTIFYKNEYLAVRNADGGFFLCQAMQNVYKTSPRIRIQWLSEEKKDSNTYIPDFYDNTDIECVLTTVEMQKVNKSSLSLPSAERSRIENILRKAIDVEKGILPRPNVTEENPDGLDISLYKNESQIEKKTPGRKRKSNPLNSGKKIASKRKLAKKKKKTKPRKELDSSDSNDESEEENDDKEYKPSRKKAVLTQPMPRVQRSPLARARAASPITIRKELPPRARKLVPQKSLTATKSEETNEVGSPISSTSGSSRGDRAKRRGTESITEEVEESVAKKAVASNQNKKTESKPIARAKTSEDDQIPVEDSFKVVQLAETEATGTKNNTTKPEIVETPPARNAKAGSTYTVGTKKNKTSAPSGSASGSASQAAPGGRTTRFRK